MLIDEYLVQAVRESHIPGIVALVTNRDEVIYAGAFGSRNVALGQPMTVDSIFRIASMTKPVTSAATMMLVEEGVLALDDSASAYLPGRLPTTVFETFDAADHTYTSRPANGEITVRHLLTNTSGLGYAIFNDTLFALLGDQSPPPSSLGYPLLHDPGARWTYGESTRVLGYLIESVTERSLDEFLRERMFAPLGMDETSYVVSGEDNARLVTFHVTPRSATNGDSASVNAAPGTAATENSTAVNDLVEQANPEGEVAVIVRGDGNLFSTAADYARFMRMILNGGVADDGARLLDEASIDLMSRNRIGDLRVERMPAPNPFMARPFPLGAGSDTFGFGFQITADHDRADTRSPGSLSWAGIYNTQFWIDPAAGIGAVLLMQYRPFYDEAAIETLQGFEARVYSSLE